MQIPIVMLHTAGGDFFTFCVYSLHFCNQNQRVSKGKNGKSEKIHLRRCDRSRFFSCFRFAAGLSGNVCRTQTAVRAPLVVGVTNSTRQSRSFEWELIIGGIWALFHKCILPPGCVLRISNCIVIKKLN